MKQFIFRSFRFIAFFVVFFIAINALYLAVLATTDWDFKKRIESLKFEDPDFDLLAMGASTSFDAFDAELLSKNGFSSYNLAMGGNTIKSSYIQLKEYLENYTNKPRYVLLGHNSPYVDNVDNEKVHPLIELTLKDHKYVLNDAPILKLKWLGFEFLKKAFSSAHRQATLSLGQLRFQKVMPDHTTLLEQYLDIQKYESSYWFGEIGKLCKQNEIELLIIEMPGVKETQNFTAIGPHTITFGNGHTANLYNLNSKDFCSIFEADKDWIGNSHLNEAGAIKFTEELFSLLEK